jgi:hypothetical protein
MYSCWRLNCCKPFQSKMAVRLPSLYRGAILQCLPNHPLLKFAVPDHDEGAKLYFDNEVELRLKALRPVSNFEARNFG